MTPKPSTTVEELEGLLNSIFEVYMGKLNDETLPPVTWPKKKDIFPTIKTDAIGKVVKHDWGEKKTPL